MKPKALILLAKGTNRDNDVAEALSLSGAEPVTIPVHTLREGNVEWSNFQILVLPGGFSYADALGAGKLLALDLKSYFTDEIQVFVATGKPVIGICNGFQALVRSGILPGQRGDLRDENRKEQATLTFNEQGHFECRWVTLRPLSQRCIWTKDLEDPIECPVAHGEGNFQVSAGALLADLKVQDQIALTYIHEDGRPANGAYPANPNGSKLDIAGICNLSGNVLGLMPHPENHVRPFQHPRWKRGQARNSGLWLFTNGVRFAEEQ
jgi:phosphoribosylformylglycinamidine synthase subunit PurQ / glutaminase